MRKHFKLPASEWDRVRTEFAQLLAKESRPISCYEVLKDRLIAGLTNVRPDELGYILREDSQFVDLGFLIFARATWASDPEFRHEMSRRRRLRVGRCEGERNGVHARWSERKRRLSRNNPLGFIPDEEEVESYDPFNPFEKSIPKPVIPKPSPSAPIRKALPVVTPTPT
jgi:hypothetical protein